MLGFRPEQLHCVFQLLAAIIHLGDVRFTSSEDDHSNTERVVVQTKDKLKDGELRTGGVGSVVGRNIKRDVVARQRTCLGAGGVEDSRDVVIV